MLLDEDGGSGDDAVVLTDILGLEDALGTMDFKVAGNEKGERALGGYRSTLLCEWTHKHTCTVHARSSSFSLGADHEAF